MRSRRHAREPEVDPFYDMLFNMLIAFVFCFIIALLAMNPKALKAGDVKAKAEFILTLSWPDGDPNDLDIYVLGPNADLVWFRSRESGAMHLDRDDRGLSNDTLVVNGQRMVNPLNQEVVALRGIVAGEYVVNAHYYESKSAPGDARADGPGAAGSAAEARRAGQPVEATLSVVKVNPVAEVVYYGQRTLARMGEEVTMVRFTVAADGSVSGISTLPKSLVGTR